MAVNPGASPTQGGGDATVLQSFDLFPTRVWQGQLAALQPHFAQWVAWVLALRAEQPTPAGRTNRSGWNSQDMTVLERPNLVPLRQAVTLACTQALEEMGLGKQRFTLQSWINLHEHGGFNFLHMHEGSMLSGTFYLKVPQGSGPLVFRDPRAGVLHSAVKGPVPNGHCDIELAPSEGLLVLFPAWMEHYVEPHEGHEPRICIAFNANSPAGT